MERVNHQFDLQRILRGSMLLFLAVVVAACNSEEPGASEDNNQLEPRPVESSQDERESDDEGIQSESVHPLTGIGTDEVQLTRPLAVVVTNDRNARPLTGLQEADIVYEVLTEAAITRFVAIYHSEQPDRIGPVRSSRETFIDVSLGYDPLFIGHGYSPGAEQRLNSGEIDQLNGMDYDGTLFSRDPSRVPPHNSFVSFQAMIEGAESSGIDMTGEVTPLMFDEEPLDGDEATGVTISYMNSTSAGYTYDASSEQYMRMSDGDPLVDEKSGEIYSMDNVFIVEAPHEVIDDEGRRHIELSEGGRAILMQNGQYTEVNWQNEQDRIIPDSEQFIPGRTWINIVPSLDSVNIHSE